MNDRERSVLAKLSEYKFCPNETKAVLHMLGGGDFRTVPVTDSSRERLITMLKKKGIIEKVGKRYLFTPAFAGVFNGGSVRDGQVVPSVAPRALPAAPEQKPAEPFAPPPTIAPVPAPPQVSAPTVQVPPQAASQSTAPPPPPATPPAVARFPQFSPLANAFLCRPSAQQADTCRAWFSRQLGETQGQVVLDNVSDLAAGVEPRHSPALDKLLAQCEQLARQIFRK